MNKNPEAPEKSQDFARMAELLAQHSMAHTELQRISAIVNAELLALLEHKREAYASLQETLTKTAAELETIALNHPEWFTDKRSITMPFGTVKLTRTWKLDVPNEEASILLILDAAKENAELAQCVRTVESLDLEALEKLPDAVLKSFRIKRISDDSFSVKPKTVDMGKAVKQAVDAAEQKEAA